MTSIAVPTVLHVLHSLRPSAGGPSRTVPALCAAVARTGQYRVLLLTTRRPGEESAFVDRSLVEVIEIPWSGRSWTPLLQRRCLAEIRNVHQRQPLSLLHDHGQWLASNRAAASASRRLRLPRIVSPRGMLSPWARSHHGHRKKLLWLAHGRRDVHTANGLHATSELERDELKALGLNQQIGVIPNGIEVPEDLPNVPRQTTPRVALFLSRIHPKKGLAELVEAWSRLRPTGWKVVIAGADDGGHLPGLREKVGAAGLEETFEFVGPVEGQEKWERYRQASLFVLPSFSENFGVVVGEALACGTPVITTRATPWESLLTHRCGWWIETGTESLINALREALAQPETLEPMGHRGRDLVRERFNWQAIGNHMADFYSQFTAAAGPKSKSVVSG